MDTVQPMFTELTPAGGGRTQAEASACTQVADRTPVLSQTQDKARYMLKLQPQGPSGQKGLLEVCVKAETVPWQKPVERGKTGGGGKWRLRYSQNDKLGYRGREKRVSRAKGKLDRPCRPKTAWLTCASRCRSWGAMEILEGSMALSGLGLEGFLGHEIVRP